MAQVYKPIYALIESYNQAQEDALAATLTGKPSGYSQIWNSTIGVVRIWDGAAFVNNPVNPLYLYSSNNLSDVVDKTAGQNNLLPSRAGNTLKVLRVKEDESGWEVATINGGSGLSQAQVQTIGFLKT